ncbi:MAG: hypothetical protein JSW67_07365 [Candidatus Latescibacterota bacterium]|nr:MAG: hypothetical protein JSW67_07365 [Candidatus Latescibacterota bacterium]
MPETEQRTLWEKVAHNLQDWYSEAVGWTGEKARIGVKKMDIVGIQHNIKRAMTHLGGRVYDLMQRGVNVENDEQVKLMVGNLRKLEEELAAREREIDELRSSRRGAETPEEEVALVEGAAETQAAQEDEEEETPR